MAAPEGNTYWEMREKHGRDRIYTAEALWQKFGEYEQWCLENPWYKNDFVRGGESAGMIVKLETARPMTITGFCAFASISQRTFDAYSKADEKPEKDDMFRVCTHIREIIYTQKFEGAAVGAFNANLIARDLGLTDKQETKWSGDINHTITGMEVK